MAGVDLKSELETILSKVATSQGFIHFEVKLDITVQIGDGFMGQLYTGTVISEDRQKTLEVLIKKAPSSDFDFTSLYKNEVTFYTSVYPALGQLSHGKFNNVPKVYSWSCQYNKSYLAMENLKSQGYTLYPKEKCFDPAHLRLIFNTYGNFHALSFIWKKREPENFKKIHKEGFKDFLQLMILNCQQIFQNCFQAALNYLDSQSPVYQELKTLPQNIVPTFLAAIQYKGQYSCSVHGDCWSNNLMFKYGESKEPEDLKLIDFQLARESTPIHDLSYFFYSGASADDLEHLEEYLQLYYISFSHTLTINGENPGEILPYEVLLEEWKNNALLGLILAVHLWEIKLTPKEEFTEDLKNATDGGKNGTTDMEKLLKMFEKFGNTVTLKEFEERVVPLLVHAYQFGVLRKEKIVEDISH